MTPQRRTVLSYIHERAGNITAEEIINHVQKEMPEVNKSTIYRTLDLLENTGCIYKSESKNGNLYHHAEEGHYHHVVCQKCGKTTDLEEEIFLEVEKTLLKKYGFQVNFKHMVIQGICKNCKNKSD